MKALDLVSASEIQPRRLKPIAIRPLDSRSRRAPWSILAALLLVNLPVLGAPVSQEVDFPTFEPFVASRMWPVMFGEPGSSDDITAAVQRIREYVAAATDPSGDLEEIEVRPQEGRIPPPGNATQRFLLTALPSVFMELEPLWGLSEWNTEQVALASAAGEFVALLPDGPDVSFSADDQAGNQESLHLLVEWFHEQVGKPEICGHMIATFDDGPWRGLPADTEEILPAVSTQIVGSRHELRLCRLSDERGAWCLQGTTDGELAWTEILSAVPTGSFDFTGHEPTPLGPYGWKIHMSFGEYTHVYVGRDGNLLFYFTSW